MKLTETRKSKNWITDTISKTTKGIEALNAVLYRQNISRKTKMKIKIDFSDSVNVEFPEEKLVLNPKTSFYE